MENNLRKNIYICVCVCVCMTELLCYKPEILYINNASVKKKKKNYQNINKKAETALFQQRFV